PQWYSGQDGHKNCKLWQPPREKACASVEPVPPHDARAARRVGAGCVCAVFCRNAGAEQNQIWCVFSWAQKEISAELLAADQTLFSFSEYERDERQSAPTC